MLQSCLQFTRSRQQGKTMRCKIHARKKHLFISEQRTESTTRPRTRNSVNTAKNVSSPVNRKNATQNTCTQEAFILSEQGPESATLIEANFYILYLFI